MRLSTSTATCALALVTSIVVAACGKSDGSGPTAIATVSGIVSASTGGVIEGASVKIGSATATTDADGRFEIGNLPVGDATITTSAPLFDSRSQSVSLIEGANVHDVVLTRQPTATVSGVVTAGAGAIIEGAIQGASVKIGGRTVTTGADGRFEIENVAVGNTTISTSAPGFAERSVSVSLVAGPNTRDIVLTPTGEWELRAPLLHNNSELAIAEANGKLYLLGGYPPNRVTSRTVQVYDIASNSWSLGPQLPQPNNHGMAASVNGKIYLIGGQTSDVSEIGHVNTVYELDPATGTWVAKAPMPTARSSGVAVVHDGKIYVAGGRPPREKDFAVYDPATNSWETLPELPSQRNHMTGAAINGRIHVVGGRIGHGLGIAKTAVHEVFDPETRSWTTAAPMLGARSGMNGVMARGCFHVWGGESQEGMSPDHDYYDPGTNQWKSLPDMPLPVHGVNGSAFVDGLIRAAGGGTNVGGSFGSLLNQVFRPMVKCE
jgi:hypothetical protein